MKYPSEINHITPDLPTPKLIRASEMDTAFKNTEEFENFFKLYRLPYLDDLLTKLVARAGKKSFLVFKHNKYFNVLTETIAFFYIKHESTIIVCFDKQEYFVNPSLEQVQKLLTEQQFFRINRQYLLNFNAVKNVEHYFARKLLVNLVISTEDKLLVSKEKANDFLHWLDNR